MIELTRINDSKVIINERYIESIIVSADTIVTLINGKSYAVSDSLEQIMEKIREYNKTLIK